MIYEWQYAMRRNAFGSTSKTFRRNRNFETQILSKPSVSVPTYISMLHPSNVWQHALLQKQNWCQLKVQRSQVLSGIYTMVINKNFDSVINITFSPMSISTWTITSIDTFHHALSLSKALGGLHDSTNSYTIYFNYSLRATARQAVKHRLNR